MIPCRRCQRADRGDRAAPFGGKPRYVTLPITTPVVAAETYAAAGALGLGLIESPRYRVASELSAGKLVEVLADSPPSPVFVLYPQSRQFSPRVRVFIDWLAAEFANRLPTGKAARNAGA